MGVGTLGFQAPEQIEGYPTLSSDVYSIGVIAVQLLSRKSPKDLVSGYRLRWEPACSSVSKEWKYWLSNALESKEKRFPDARSALQELLEPSSELLEKEDTPFQNTPQENDRSSVESTTTKIIHTHSKLVQLQSQLRQIQTRYEIAWMCIFFLSIFAIPIIYYFYKKRQELRIEIKHHQNAK